LFDLAIVNDNYPAALGIRPGAPGKLLQQVHSVEIREEIAFSFGYQLVMDEVVTPDGVRLCSAGQTNITAATAPARTPFRDTVAEHIKVS